MIDIQKQKDSRMKINQVGIKDLLIPLIISDKNKSQQQTIAKVSLSVGLPKKFKGTHMSRFIEILEEHILEKKISMDDFERLLGEIKEKLHAKSAYIEFDFRYFITKTAPVSKKKGIMDYECKFIASSNGKFRKKLVVKVPITTLCPCSKAISQKGAHNQRSYVTVSIRTNEFVWIEDLISLVEKKASCEIYSLLKREDEKYVTERAYDNPKFVEDVVRDIATELKNMESVKSFSVYSEHLESIHNHNAFALIKGGKNDSN